MNRLILITGDLASGKSTLADNLSKKLNIAALKKDCVKEILADTIGFETREQNRKLSIASIEEMTHFFNQCANVGTDLILDANFHSLETAELRRISLEKNYQVCLIMLTGNKELLYERFKERLKNRHRAHMSLHLDSSFDAFSDYLDGLRSAELIFPVERIDMSEMTPEEVLKEVLSILDRYHML